AHDAAPSAAHDAAHSAAHSAAHGAAHDDAHSAAKRAAHSAARDSAHDAPRPATATASGPNTADALFARARQDPQALALRVARRTLLGRLYFDDTTYGELATLADFVSRDLLRRGARRGDRVCLFVPPGPQLFACAFGLFRAGLVPVLIDPGMGRANLLACVKRMAPRVFIGIRRAVLLRRLFPRAFASVELSMTVDPWLRDAQARASAPQTDLGPCPPHNPRHEAAVLFTSGSTGPPKGVSYTHANFLAQTERLQALYRFTPGEVDLSCFPLFALFCPSLGITSVIPEVNPSRPARFNPARLLEVAAATGATTSFGSPAIWRRLVPWCQARGRTAPGIRRVLMAGAPVPPDLLADLQAILPAGAEVHTPYGATESLPVASINASEVLALALMEATGKRPGERLAPGTCVGRVVPKTQVRLIPIIDGPVEGNSLPAPLPANTLGEVCVAGPQVTRAYAEDPAATAAAKFSADGVFWHRMGDGACFDDTGRLWFQGRIGHRLETAAGRIMPVPVELPFQAHSAVRRCALVGIGPRGAEIPVLVVEAEAGHARGALRHKLAGELLELARSFANAADADLGPAAVHTVLFHPSLPVDVRHNAKLDRPALKRWATEQFKGGTAR
ncbi:MAG: hypothetical protein CMJ87_11530, partial [Planctomycetes bacterium]|nr:hypothetical protein [Planctomycetota bacterium]